MFDFFINPQNVLHLSSRVLGAGLALLLMGIYGAYLYDGHLPIVALVTMHAMTIIGPTLLKIGYVMRLLAQHRLGKGLVGAVA
ncbi:transmembrane sensor/regulator PpyR [Pseudomonas sp. MDT2-39-1]|uniref:transmembrane sensor/regulator PpyR n=1 Tax=Pseudomonas sp. BGI-2 TaxID=2528211 RepID=UPI0010332C26|nr:transmembrane sensor/regulator PpyR [Pseudomonas sp. BGI-2]TBN35392.1 transmembrane sensor/regulator PpyR [Pseudomonas sp. BGI-2]